MSSYASSDGSMTLTVTFKLGTNLDIAQVLVQNRVAIATPRLPEEVRRLGITTRKSSPDLMMVVHMLSPDESYDQLYISNYAQLRVREQLLRLDGVGDIRIFGSREYSLRVWLDPEKLSAYGLTGGDVVRALQEQNVQVSGGALGQEPVQRDNAFQLVVTTQGRFEDLRQFRNVIVRAGEDGRLIRVQDVARVEMGAREYVTNSYLNGKPAVALAIFQRPGTNALATAVEIIAKMDELKRDFPSGLNYTIVYNPTEFIAESVNAVYHTLFEAILLGRPRRHRFPAVLARLADPDPRHPSLADRHLRGPRRIRVQPQRAHSVRAGAGHRHRRRRCDRGGREHRAQHRSGHDPARRRARDDGRSRHGGHRHRDRAVRGVHSDGVHPRHQRPVLQAVRADHRGRDDHLGVQFADPVACPRRAAAQAA